jgi:serine/threonine protein kinase
MWAAGIIMFELITGYHPLYEDGDTRQILENKLKKYTEIKIPSKSMSPQARHLISCLCQRNISFRYSADKSLQHPFITRNLDEALPLTNAEFKRESVKSLQIEAKIRRAINVFMVCGVV